jgi:hypothetical protein
MKAFRSVQRLLWPTAIAVGLLVSASSTALATGDHDHSGLDPEMEQYTNYCSSCDCCDVLTCPSYHYGSCDPETSSDECTTHHPGTACDNGF